MANHTNQKHPRIYGVGDGLINHRYYVGYYRQNIDHRRLINFKSDWSHKDKGKTRYGEYGLKYS